VPAALPELPIQFADYALWERAHWTPERLDRSLGFFRRALAETPLELDLSAGLPRSPVGRLAGSRWAFALSPAVGEALTGLARRAGATPFAVLLAGFSAVLGRWAGCERLIAGTPLANRERSETAGLLGCFVNLLPVAVDLGGDPPFRELAERLHAAVQAATAHALPFEHLVD